MLASSLSDPVLAVLFSAQPEFLQFSCNWLWIPPCFVIPGCLDLFSLILPKYSGSVEEVVEGSPWFLAHISPSGASSLIAPQQPVHGNNSFLLQNFLKKNVRVTCLIIPHSILTPSQGVASCHQSQVCYKSPEGCRDMSVSPGLPVRGWLHGSGVGSKR